jgi:type III secretion protein O
MKGYPLDTLLRVRSLREDNSIRALKAAEAAYAEARLTAAEKEKALAAYRVWRKEEEDRRYLEIMLQHLSLDELDKFHDGLRLLKDGEISREEELEKARAALLEAGAEVEKAKKIFLQARMDTQKILGHRDIWLQEQAKEELRAEDLEMEDFSGRNIFSTMSAE